MADANGLTAIFYGVALLGISAAAASYSLQPNKESTITVDSKERGRGDSSNDLVYTADKTFKVGDSWTRGRFNSADTYGMLRPGCSYRVTHYGYRLGLISAFPNIIAAEHVATPACPTNGGMSTRAPRRR